jgi:hypothetical protein
VLISPRHVHATPFLSSGGELSGKDFFMLFLEDCPIGKYCRSKQLVLSIDESDRTLMEQGCALTVKRLTD